MGVLGLNEPVSKDDNLFQRLFWPSDQPGEADALGVQGFWICAIVATISTIALFVIGLPLLALLTAAFFGLGGVGVRERSVSAAVIVSAAYVINQAVNVMSGTAPGALGIIATLMLLANIRSTRIAAKWHAVEVAERAVEPDAVIPEVSVYTKIWRGARIPFYVVSVIYLGVCVLAVVGLATRKPAAQQPKPLQIKIGPPVR